MLPVFFRCLANENCSAEFEICLYIGQNVQKSQLVLTNLSKCIIIIIQSVIAKTEKQEIMFLRRGKGTKVEKKEDTVSR